MKKKADSELETGRTYLIKKAKPYLSTKLFQSVINGGGSGLTVTRLYPDKLEEEYEIDAGKVQSIWLSRAIGEKNIDPVKIGPLAMQIENFINEHETSIILLEGIEYLMLVNGFDVVHRFVEYLHERIVGSDSMLIISISPNAFEEREMAILERNKEIVDMPLITFSEGGAILDLLEQ